MTRNAPILIEVTPDLAKFILKNCDTNLKMGLVYLQQLKSRDLQEELVSNLENFKALSKATKDAIDEASDPG